MSFEGAFLTNQPNKCKQHGLLLVNTVNRFIMKTTASPVTFHFTGFGQVKKIWLNACKPDWLQFIPRSFLIDSLGCDVNRLIGYLLITRMLTGGVVTLLPSELNTCQANSKHC